MANAISIIVSTSILILLILLIRRVYWKKCNPNILYFIWIFVAIRILFPFSIAYSIPIDYLQQYMPEDQNSVLSQIENNLIYVSDTDIPDTSSIHDTIQEQNLIQETPNYSQEASTETEPLQTAGFGYKSTAKRKLLTIYLSGCVLFAVSIIVVNLKFMYGIKKRQIGLLNRKIPVYEVDGHNCLVGIWKPCIFLSPQICHSDVYRKYVIMHELEHYKVKDNFWMLLKTICLMLQWFNPLVWIAYYKSTEDSDLACDYRVLLRLNHNDRDGYAESLLYVLESNKRPSGLVSEMAKGKKVMKKRINNLYNKNSVKKHIWLLGAAALITIVAFVKLSISSEAIKHTTPESNGNASGSLLTEGINNPSELDMQTYSEILVENLSDIEKKSESSYTVSYTTNLIKGGNHYWIDEDDCLWGTGTTEYGQLGNLDESLSKVFEPIAIAENVIHVDFSGEYFLIFVTSDHKLYGMGGNAAGILDHASIDYRNGSYMNVLTSPVLLMENVIYAKCGYSTIIALQENGDVYVLGNNHYVPFVSESYVAPQKLMENAKYVTSYFHSYAAIDENNSLWTWGNNQLGQCGIGSFSNEIAEPQKILDDVACAWMGEVAFNSSGEVSAHDCLIALKIDGSALGCGEGIGNEVSAFEGINDFDVQHPQKAIASASLFPIQFREFVPFSLQGVELYWSEEELIQFLAANGIEYHTDYTYEGHYLLYTANNGEWEFIFDSSGQLAVITSTKTDEIEKNVLKSGDSLEQAIDSYGRNYVVRNQQYNYSELVYDMDGYSFVIGGYSDLGCAKFSVEISGFMN